MKNVGVFFDCSTIVLWYYANNGTERSTNFDQDLYWFHGFFDSNEWEAVEKSEIAEESTSIGCRVK